MASRSRRSPQHRVDEAGGRRNAPLRRRHRLVDQGVLGVRRRLAGPQQRQRGDEQRVDVGRRRLGHQPVARLAGTAEPAQRVKAQCLHAGTAVGRNPVEDIVQRAPTAHRLHCVGGQLEQAGQRLRRRGIGGCPVIDAV